MFSLIKKFLHYMSFPKLDSRRYDNYEKAVAHFILFDLRDNICDSIFYAQNYSDLGKVYFKIIQKKFLLIKKGNLITIINNLYSSLGLDNDEAQTEYAKLCKIIRIVALPYSVFQVVNNSFDAVFDNLKQEIEVKYKSVLASLNAEMTNIKKTIDQNKSIHFLPQKDFSEKIISIKELYFSQNDLRTKIDILNDYYSELTLKIEEYCDLSSKKVITDRKKLLTIKHCFNSFSVSDENSVTDYDLEINIYRHYFEAFRYIAENSNNMFFVIKFFPFSQLAYKEVRINHGSKNEDALNEYINITTKINSSIDNLARLKKENISCYSTELSNVIEEYSIICHIH